MFMKNYSIYTFILGMFFTYALFTSYSGKNETTETENTEAANGLPQQIRAVQLADRSFDYAGEALPMSNFDVVERLDREILRNSYYHSNTILLLKRMKRYFPIIEPILAEQGVPDDLKFLSVIESDLTNARSPAGAKGFWQFLKGTAGDYGLQVNSEVDERYNLEKATVAACKYLKRYKEKFGSWTMAAAAYNMGPSGLQSEINRQKFDDYYKMNLNHETGRYVFRIVAIKEILSNPENYGFELGSEDKYNELPEFTVMSTNDPIPSLGEFAKKYGTTYRMIKLYNPWLTSYKLTNSARKTYKIKIPK